MAQMVSAELGISEVKDDLAEMDFGILESVAVLMQKIKALWPTFPWASDTLYLLQKQSHMSRVRRWCRNTLNEFSGLPTHRAFHGGYLRSMMAETGIRSSLNVLSCKCLFNLY